MEVSQIVEIILQVGAPTAICLWVMDVQKKQIQQLLDFMMDQIKKQTEVLETIKEQMTVIKEDLNNLKGEN